MSDFICQKYTDCSSCSHYQKQIFKYRSFPKVMMIPKERCSQNTIYFLISGSVRVTSDEHPDTVFHDGQFIMQPIGSRVEFHILESTECILYLFETPQNICTDRFNKGLELAKESPMQAYPRSAISTVSNPCLTFPISAGPTSANLHAPSATKETKTCRNQSISYIPTF